MKTLPFWIEKDDKSITFAGTASNKEQRYCQAQNPKSKKWVKIDRVLGKIIGHKSTPYKNVEKV